MTQSSWPHPLYQTIKNYVINHIQSGEWEPGRRIPSEAEMGKSLDASRMTVNRAIRELSAEGHVTRVQGVGTFVAKPRPHATLLNIRSISEEIADRGGVHRCEVISQSPEATPVHIARALQIATSVPVFHLILVHLEDSNPVQIEDRYVNPVVAPEFLDQDYTKSTPSEYLLGFLPVTEIEHNIMSRLPDDRESELLDIPTNMPVLELSRRSWSGRHVVTHVRLTGPGPLFKVGGRFKTGEILQG